MKPTSGSRDEQALAFRKEGRSFGKIATLLGFENSREAVTAYQRAAELRPAAEQATLPRSNRNASTRWPKPCAPTTTITKADATKRLARIERLRALVG